MKYLILISASLIALPLACGFMDIQATSRVDHGVLIYSGFLVLFGVLCHWVLAKMLRRFRHRYSRTGNETHARACREVIRIYSHRMFGKSSDYRNFIRQVEGHGLDYNSEGWKRFPSAEQALHAFRQWSRLEK